MNTIISVPSFYEMSKERYPKGNYKIIKENLTLFRDDEILDSNDKREPNSYWGDRKAVTIRKKLSIGEVVEYLGKGYSNWGSDPAPEDEFKIDNKIFANWAQTDTFGYLEKI